MSAFRAPCAKWIADICLALLIFLVSFGPVLAEPGRSEDDDDGATDGFVSVTGNVVLVNGPLSAGMGISFELRVIEAIVFTGNELPVLLLLNIDGGSSFEADRIKRVIATYQHAGVSFHATVNHLHRCDRSCSEILTAANHRILSDGSGSDRGVPLSTDAAPRGGQP